MKITDSTNARENWHEVTTLWNRAVNWSHYDTSQRELTLQIKSLLIFICNEKDWLKKEYPSQAHKIEHYIDNSTYIKIVSDLANTIKHKGLDRKSRSNAVITDYYGKIQLGKNKARQMYFIQNDDSKILEIFPIICGAINEYKTLHHELNDARPQLLNANK